MGKGEGVEAALPRLHLNAFSNISPNVNCFKKYTFIKCWWEIKFSAQEIVYIYIFPQALFPDQLLTSPQHLHCCCHCHYLTWSRSGFITLFTTSSPVICITSGVSLLQFIHSSRFSSHMFFVTSPF